MDKIHTILTLFQKAIQPVGSTMYIWGGGWNENDTGAGDEAVTLGTSKRWCRFACRQNADYDWKRHRYQIHDGLDCSGYLGWVLYNTLEQDDGKPGYVWHARDAAAELANRGWGWRINMAHVKTHQPGDVMCNATHVYLVVGACDDGSAVLLHASPPGVQFCGTATPAGNFCSKAIGLSEKVMRHCYPRWYERFPNCARDASYLTDYEAFRWDTSGNGILSDPEGMTACTAETLLSRVMQKKKEPY